MAIAAAKSSIGCGFMFPTHFSAKQGVIVG